MAIDMRITVKFRGPIAGRMGTPEIRLEFERDVNLRELLRKLIDTKEEVRGVWSSPEQLNQNSLLLRNGVDIELTGGLETRLSNEDNVVILPLVHGG
jgi:molybdopterin converting factor small subunit